MNDDDVFKILGFFLCLGFLALLPYILNLVWFYVIKAIVL